MLLEQCSHICCFHPHYLEKHLFSAFVPLVLKICNNPGLYSDPVLRAAAALTLGKICMIR